MTVKTAAEVPSDVQKRCSLVHNGMSLSKRNCIESNSDVPANHVESEGSDLWRRIPPMVSQERFTPQLIARGLPFNQKLHRLYKMVH